MIARKSALNFGTTIFCRFLGLISLVVVALYMGPVPIGMIGYAEGIIGLFTIFATMGLGATHRKIVSEGQDIGKCVGTFAIIKVSITAFWVLVFALWIVYFYKPKSLFSEEFLVLVILATSAIVLGFLDIFKETFLGKREIAKVSLTQIIAQVVETITKVLVAILGFGVIFLAGSTLLFYIVWIILLVILFRGIPVSRPDSILFKRYVTFSMSVGFVSVLAHLALNINKMMIGYFAGMESLGEYIFPLRISTMISMFGSSLGLVLMPAMSSADAKGKTERVNKLVTVSMRYISLILMPLIFTIIILASFFFPIVFGTDFDSSSELLRILSIIAFLNVISRPYLTQIISVGNLRAMIIIGFSTVLPQIFSALVLIPDNLFGYNLFGLGALGAVYATLIGVLCRITLGFYYCTLSNTQKIKSILGLSKQALIGVAILLVWVHLELSVTNSICLIVSAFVILSVYWLGLFAIKELYKEDIIFFMDLFNPRKMFNYISDEMEF